MPSSALTSLAALCLLSLAGCASAPPVLDSEPEPESAAEQEGSPSTPAVEEPVAPPEADPAEAEADGPTVPGPTSPDEEREPTPVIVVAGELGPDTPAEEAPSQAPSLYEASLRARRERAVRRQESALVITDETLEADAASGKLTMSDVSVTLPESETQASETTAVDTGSVASDEDEIYWRRRVLDARLAWREAVATVEEREELVAQLRYDFYATDDPYLRDSSIKPAWDRALGELEAARQDAELRRAEIDGVLEEGRRAGALPGWLREGLDLEPRDESQAPGQGRLDEHRMADPVEMEEASDSGP